MSLPIQLVSGLGGAIGSIQRRGADCICSGALMKGNSDSYSFLIGVGVMNVAQHGARGD